MAKVIRASTDEISLLVEAHRVNYRLRSTFFYRKIKEYGVLSLPAMVTALLPFGNLYSWDEREAWGISQDAFSYVSDHPSLHPLEVFSHPKLLREQPHLLPYYRNIAALSQKSVGYLTKINAQKLETAAAKGISLREDYALTLARLFNQHVSLIVEASIQSLTKEELHGVLLASTGAQIDGSWRNAIGEEAEKVVQRLLINEAKERQLLAALITRADNRIEWYDPAKLSEQLGNIHNYRGVLLTNQTSILFSSEPDVSLLDASGNTVCAMEIKGGTDPAGALERYGAAKKSFEESRRFAPEVHTILVASCITSEVHSRIAQDETITSYYNLTALLSDDSRQYKEFMQETFSLLEQKSDEPS